MCDFLQSVHDEFKKILTEQGVLTDEQISISCARAIEVIQFKNSGDARRPVIVSYRVCAQPLFPPSRH